MRLQLTLAFFLLLFTNVISADDHLQILIPPTAGLVSPFGVDFDQQGVLYLVELEGGRFFKFTTTEGLTKLAGDGTKSYKGDGGPLSDVTFNGPHNLAVAPDGTVYIADTWNNVVRKYDPQKKIISTIAGTGAKGFAGDGEQGSQAKFNGTFCVTLNHDHSKLYITDLGNKRIRVLDLKTNIITTVAGNGKGGVPKDGTKAIEVALVDPRAATIDQQGQLFILERGGHALRVVKLDGTIHTLIGNGKGKADGDKSTAQLSGPKHLCVDLQQNIIIADEENHLIRKYDVKTGILSTLPIKGLKRPHGVYVHQDGTLYIADSYNNRVLTYKE